MSFFFHHLLTSLSTLIRTKLRFVKKIDKPYNYYKIIFISPLKNVDTLMQSAFQYVSDTINDDLF